MPDPAWPFLARLTDAYRELGGVVRAVEAQRLAMLTVLIERGRSSAH